MGVGSKLKFLLKEKGMSQREFADVIEENVTQVNKVLNEERPPNYEFLEKSLIHFGQVDLNWLLRDEYSVDSPVPLVNENKIAYSSDVIDDILNMEQIISRLKSKVSQ